MYRGCSYCFAWILGLLPVACLAETPSDDANASVSYSSQLKRLELVTGDVQASAQTVFMGCGRTHRMDKAGHDVEFGEPHCVAMLEGDVVVQSPKWKAKSPRLDLNASRATLCFSEAVNVTEPKEITVEVADFTAKASRVDIDRKSGRIDLSGPVTIEGKGFQLTAANAIYVPQSSDVLMHGGKEPVRIKLGNKVIEAKSTRFDLRTKEATECKDKESRASK